MRADPGVFVGADSNRLEKIDVVPGEEGEFTWGAFTISPAAKTYSADVETAYDMSFYHGTFAVDSNGRWVAGLPNRAQAHKREPGAPDGR